MDILKHFVFDKTTYDVHIIWESEKPLFRAKDLGIILSLSNINKSVINYNSKEKVITESYTLGGEQLTTYLTKRGVYRLLFSSTKSIAIPFREWILDILEEIEEKGKYELDSLKKNFDDKNELLENMQKDYQKLSFKYENSAIVSNHEILLKHFEQDKYNIVYVGLIREINGKKLIKIGKTKNMKNRAKQLQETFGSFYYLNCEKVDSDTSFEDFLLKHKTIKEFKYNGIINIDKEGKEHRSHEVFLVDDKEYQTVLNIIKKHSKSFISEVKKPKKEDTIVELTRKLSRLEDLLLQRDVEVVKEIEDNISEEDNIDLENEKNNFYTQDLSQLYGRNNGNIDYYIQRYSPDGKTLLKVYTSYTAAMNDPQLNKPSRNGIINSIKGNTIECEYRWATISKQLEWNTTQILEETNNTNKFAKEQVVKTNKEKTKILEVYSSQEEAKEFYNLNTSSTISVAIKRGNATQGGYWYRWSETPIELRDEYLENNELPEKTTANNSKEIDCYDAYTNEFVKSYKSIKDVMVSYNIGRDALRSSIKYGKTIQGKRFYHHIDKSSNSECK